MSEPLDRLRRLVHSAYPDDVVRGSLVLMSGGGSYRVSPQEVVLNRNDFQMLDLLRVRRKAAKAIMEGST